MRPSKFSEAQMVRALRQVREGTPAAQMCRTLGITQTTFYRWRARYESAPDSDLSDISEVRELRDENQKLKMMVANLMLKEQRGTKSRRE